MPYPGFPSANPSVASAPVRVLVVSDVRIFREGVAELLRSTPPLAVVGTASCGAQAIASVRELRPHVVLLDLALTEGVDALHAIATALPSQKVVAIGVPESEGEVIACVEAGAAGLASRDASREQLVEVVQSAVRGEFTCSPRVGGFLIRRVSARSGAGDDGAALAKRLTRRELEIAELLAEGLSNKDIAAKLFIEVSTVKNHVHNILEKLGIRRRAQAGAILWRSRARRRLGPDGPRPQPGPEELPAHAGGDRARSGHDAQRP